MFDFKGLKKNRVHPRSVLESTPQECTQICNQYFYVYNQYTDVYNQ